MQESRWMTRRNWLTVTLVLGGCAKQAELPPDLFPETSGGVWRRTALRSVPVSESPDPVPRNEVEHLREAAYEGRGTIQARVYQLSSSAVGSLLAQRWRPSSDTVFFNVGRYFVVVKWQAADRQALQEFLRDLQTKLAAAAKRRQ